MSMSDKKRVGPEFNFEKMDAAYASITEEDIDRFIAESEAGPSETVLKFVESIEKNPAMLVVWDSSEPFEDFARRVKARAGKLK